MGFLLRLSGRYAWSKANRHRVANSIILIGITIAIAAIMVIFGIMNGLQNDLLQNVRDVETFDAQISFIEPVTEQYIEQQLNEILMLTGIQTAFPFLEVSAILTSSYTAQGTTVRFKGVSKSLFETKRFTQAIDIYERFSVHPDSGKAPPIMLSTGLSNILYAVYGDVLDVTMLRPGKTLAVTPYATTFQVEAFFASTSPTFDANTVLLDYDTLAEITGTSQTKIGIYFDDNLSVSQQKKLMATLEQNVVNAHITSWQQMNNALYSALFLEKILMYVFLMFMFLIIGVSIRNATKRLVLVKQREIAILRAMGTLQSTISKVFVLQALFIVLSGILLGIITGYILGLLTPELFSLLNTITGNTVPLFSYPIIIDIRVHETIIVAATVLCVGLLSSFAGSKKLVKRQIMEILTYEYR